MRAARALLACLLLAGPVGCGGGDGDGAGTSTPAATPARTPTATATATATAAAGGSRRPEVEAVLERYAQAVRAGDARAICAGLLSREVLRRVRQAGGDCERDLIADAVEAGGPSYALSVEAVEVEGDRATARTVVTDRRGTRPQVQPLVREDGRWRLSIGS